MKSNFYLLFSILFMLGSLKASAQIGMGTTTPAPSAALEVTSSANNKGILIPRITATQKDAIVSPAEGLLIYQTTAPIGFYYYMGTAWNLVANATDLATASAGSIPYTGANAAVDLGAYDLKVNSLTVGKGGGSVETNTAIGKAALIANTTGFGNTANGYNALYSNKQGYANTVSGYQTLYNNTSAYNTAIGYRALYSNTSGSANTASGVLTLYSNTTGVANMASGMYSLYSNTTGFYNTANGHSALYSNTTGFYNTANGYYALRANTTGTNNTASGNLALLLNTTGSYNTAIGNGADVESVALTNTTAIGAGAKVSVNNTIQLGNTAVTNVKTSGTITTGAVTYPNTHNTIAGQILNTDASGLASWATPTKAMVGLSSVNNTSDFEKPISNLTQLALNTKFAFEVSNEFSASAGQTSFTLTNTPGTNSKVKMYINGIRISNTSYSIVTNNDITTLTYNPLNNGVYALIIGDRIQFDFSY